ncbi:AAA family ATPase [Marinifilum sp. D737]|uniref:AAA family ATPase n=1 Tax=Marinifilum sp. D737 TaxID=2969628 RepID=UPI0022724E1A|nr:AAA family ATPase [Marinifilum sp. D737]MCY1633519.1 AAA family ATPase [Marinifilum sp. D737]
MAEKIKTLIKCENIAPIDSLDREIKSGTLKLGIFANNGSGKTFVSRLFRLSENQTNLELDKDFNSPTDKLISFGKNSAKFSFSVIDKQGNIKDDFEINLRRGQVPNIPETKYLYHTFNQDYVEENIRALGYEKDSEIEGFILGKTNIDLKDDEDRLKNIEEEDTTLSAQIKSEIESYLNTNINSIQNIKRLTEYRKLNFENVFASIDKDAVPVAKSFEELLDDYNKIKSVPENLPDITKINRLNLDFEQLNKIKDNCLKSYSLSSLADDFKTKIKEKQPFIEAGMALLENLEVCPFCEQSIEQDAISLIDNYTKYLNDTEAQTIKIFNAYKSSIEDTIELVKKIEAFNTKRIIEFNNYKTKYIPSSAKEVLVEIEIQDILNYLQQVIDIIENKLINISKGVDFEETLLEEIEKKQSLLNSAIDLNNKAISTINGKKNRINDENKNTRKLLCHSAFNKLVETHRTNCRNIVKLRKGYKKLNEEIKKKKEQQKVSKKDKVGETIKTVLNYFFSDKYTLDSETFRLKFKTNILEKNQARNVLSEGEKNIVAFAYYIGDTHLKINNEDDYQNIFFVIDDPISSMDFTHVYTLSGVIRDLDKIVDKLTRVKFLMFTHNNDFMRVLTSNNILDKRLLLKEGKLVDFNNNLTVPYINHLFDIYNIAEKDREANHTTANSIRHIIETLTKFDKIDTSRESIAEYIRENIPTDTRAYTLINDLSHGGWRSEQAPITDEDYKEICTTIISHIENEYKGQIDYCKKICY